MDYFFSTKQLAVGYEGKPLIRDIEIRLQKGRILTLIGPNGSGKSTILKTIAKYLQSIYGAVFIDGRSVGGMTEKDLSRKLSVVLTQRPKTELMTCEAVVETGRYPYTGWLGILSSKDKAQVRSAMESVDAWELRRQDFMQVSDGQRQRVLLARAICQQPQIILLDEPTSFLDIHYQLEFLGTLRDMAREWGIAVILSLHELQLAQRITDDVLCVKGETVTHYGSAREIFKRELIRELYGLKDGSYNPLFGSLEMKRTEGIPRLFVIAGGGTGIEAYRVLQRERIPFITGILHENDVDYQVAGDLANEVVMEHSFVRITDAVYHNAVEKLKGCNEVLNCLSEYGEINGKNRDLFEAAKAMGCRIVEIEEFT